MYSSGRRVGFVPGKDWRRQWRLAATPGQPLPGRAARLRRRPQSHQLGLPGFAKNLKGVQKHPSSPPSNPPLIITAGPGFFVERPREEKWDFLVKCLSTQMPRPLRKAERRVGLLLGPSARAPLRPAPRPRPPVASRRGGAWGANPASPAARPQPGL